MFQSQLINDEFERIRGVTGEHTLVQCARVRIEFEGHTFDKVVAVANKEMVSDKVLFAVPLDKGKTRDLLLGFVPGPTPIGTGHSGVTPDTQTPEESGATETES